jgi:subtilisin family serine protease
MGRDRKSNRKSVRKTRSSFFYENLEGRWMLAGANATYLIPASMYDDVFARGAVTVEHILQRATTNDFVPQQIVVAVEVPRAKNQATQYTAAIDWKAWTGQPNVSVISNMMTMARGASQSVALINLNLGPGSNPLSVVNRLAGNQQVLWSSPNFIHRGPDPREFTPNDPQYSSQYHHPLMKNNLAWDITLGNPNIKIGVTDDGVSIPHADLNPNIWVNPGEIPGNGIDDDGNGYIDDVNGWDFSSNNNDPNPNGTSNDHGTHVAGIAAGRTNNGIGIAGTAGLATIVPLQFYAGTSSWTASIINATYTYAANMGFQIVTTSYNVDSWVGDPVFLAGLQYMYNAGVLHFNSAGNNNQLNPARQVFEQSLFVSSTDAGDIKSSFSNYGTGIDVAAPGTNILATVLNNGYGTKSGTSMSTPNAAGAAALIWGANPNWNRYQVAAQLLYFVDNIDALNPAFAGLLGTGRVNPFKALTNTLPAPRINSLTGLPSAGSTSATWNVNSFTVAFNQVMNPAGVNSMSNYILREAGADGTFGTSDDQIIAVTATKTYQVGTNLMTFNIAGGPLGPGRYQLSMSSSGLRNPFNTPLDGDGNGQGGDNYVHTFTLAPDTIKLLANGSLIHEQTWSTSINSAGQTRDYYLSLDAGQTLTVISQPTGALAPTIQVRNPSGTLIGTGTIIGTSSVVSSLAIGGAGIYRITFGGSGSSTGGYNARVLLNAGIEGETLGGAANNSLASAQNLDLTALALGSRGADRLAIVGTMPSSTGNVVLSENFESGSLNSSWTTASSVAQGRILVTGTPSTAAGSFALIMDSSVNSVFARNEATWTVNLNGLQSPTLRFWEASFGDEVHTMPVSFTGSSDTDGVAISANGTTWYRVWSPTATQTSGLWTQRTVDLAAAAASAGIALGANFRIRFQQYDNFPVSTDGRGYDEITISVPAPQEDWYSFTLGDAEYASILGTRSGTTGSHQVDLYNSSGALLASGSAAGNATSMISRFQDGTSNGVRDTYFVRVTGNAQDYSLVVTRNADFDRESNDTLATAQNLNGLTGVLG